VQPTDGKRFRDLLRGMARAFGSDIDTVTLDVYWLALSDWTLEQFEAAAGHLLRNSKFMPRPAEFNALKKAGKFTAAEAWDAILQHCKGAYRDGSGIDNGGPVDIAVRGIGGYRTIAMHNLDYLPILQRQFVDRFEELDDVMEIRNSVPQLVDQNTRTQIRHDGPRHISGALPVIRRPEKTSETV
jgi:hypothetical protein